MFDPFDENKSPKDKFFEIVYNANKNLVTEELEKVFERAAILELIAQELLDEEVETKIMEIKFNKSDEVEGTLTDLYIDTMANILTNNE